MDTALTGRRTEINSIGFTIYGDPVRRCSCSKCAQKRNLERFGPEHVAYMRGYAKALRMVGNPIHFPQADQIDREYGTGE